MLLLTTRLEPWEYDRKRYERDNEVERLFRQWKRGHPLFSRFEKLAMFFLGFLLFAHIFNNALHSCEDD